MALEDKKLSEIGITVVDHVAAMLAYWDKNLMCRFANDAYKEWFGKTREELVDKLTLEQLLGETLYKKNLPYITAALEGKMQQFEREIMTPTGLRYSLASYYPDIQNGEVNGFFVHVADISKLKLLEKELIISNDTIQRQNKLLLNFSNVVSHNLKSYANNLEVILNLFINADTEEEKSETLEYIKDISKGFSSTVKNLNEIARAQNQGNTVSEQINLYDYIEKSIDVLNVQLKSSQACINNNVSKNINLLAKPAYMESIILNFLSNAIKYRHPDRNPIIDLDCIVSDSEAILKIKDNGLGINLKKHGANLFGLYKTFHNNPDAEGVGLFITNYQVESMGGIINVESEVNEGTTFSIHFML